MQDSDIVRFSEARALDQARQACEAIVKRAEDRGWAVERESFTLGLVRAAAEQAADAVFDLLNTASSYCDSENAGGAIEAHSTRRKARIEANDCA